MWCDGADLHKIGGLPTLLQLMSSQHPSLRWRAAEVAATCMANNPPVQRWFMAGGALSHILDLLSDPNVKVQTKALLAVSALVRHYQPGLEAFRLAGGLQKVLGLLGCPADPDMAALSNEAAEAAADAAEDQQEPQRRKLQRKALALLQYMLLKHPADGIAAVQYGLADRLCAMLFAAGSDSDIRQAVLAVLLEVVRQPQGWQRLSRCEAGLVGHLQQLLQQHKQLSAEDQAAAAEEQVLLEQLLSLLQSHQAPMTSGTAPAALQDHIDLDPYLDGGERKEKPLSVRGTAQQQQQQQQQQSNDAVAASGAGMALMAVPKPDLR
jgi:hsp70-interacting protein